MTLTVEVPHDEARERRKAIKREKIRRWGARKRDNMTVLKFTGSVDEHKWYIGCPRMRVERQRRQH